MGNICFSQKALTARTYLSNDFLKTALNEKSESLALEQLRIMELIQSELIDDAKALKARSQEVSNNKLLLLDAIIQQKPTEQLADCILENNVKLARLTDLKSQLFAIKNQSLSVDEILNNLDKAIDQNLVPVAPEVKDEKVEDPKLINNSNNLMPVENLDAATAVIVKLEEGLEMIAQPVLSIGADIIDGLMDEIRSKLQSALSEALKKL